jgi:hypothetical protein
VVTARGKLHQEERVGSQRQEVRRRIDGRFLQADQLAGHLAKLPDEPFPAAVGGGDGFLRGRGGLHGTALR